MTESLSGKLKIFVVEDDPIIAKLMEYRLISLGYSVCGIAPDGASGLAMIREKNPDLVLLDIGLPGELDGVGFAHVLSLETDVPFVFVTGRDDDQSLERVCQTTLYGFVRKPFDDNQLRIAIKLAVNR